MILKKRIENPVKNFVSWVLTVTAYVVLTLLVTYLAWRVGLLTFAAALVVWALGEVFTSVGGNYPPSSIYFGIFSPLVTLLSLLLVLVGIPIAMGIRRAMKR